MVERVAWRNDHAPTDAPGRGGRALPQDPDRSRRDPLPEQLRRMSYLSHYYEILNQEPAFAAAFEHLVAEVPLAALPAIRLLAGMVEPRFRPSFLNPTEHIRMYEE